jgi:5-bromo-4-chloroindolyl phosphate hydrolysis protein
VKLLARAVGKDVAFVRKDVRKMIAQGYFPQGHLDHEQNNLIISDTVYQQFEQARLELEQAQKRRAIEEAPARDPRVQEVLEKGRAFLAQIKKCNDDIPGAEVSGKINRIEHIVQKIFERVREHPEVIPDLKKLMDYYLPMTVKLLQAYADMDAQPVQGETIQNSKREIEGTLDTLNLAFEKILDELFQDTALDISSDITVLNTMLAREGLTEDELTRMKKQQNF